MRQTGHGWRVGILTVITAALLAGCTGQKMPLLQKEQAPLSAVTKTPTGVHFSGKFVWHDLLTDDVLEAKKFYTGLFEWSYEESGSYTTIYHHGKPIGGMMGIASKTGAKAEALWLPSLSVSDVDSAVAYVKSKKGTVLKGPMDMKERGRAALVSDPEGAQLVLLHTKGGDPKDQTPKMGDWLWNELWTNKPKESYSLYHNLGKYDASKMKDGYRILKRHSKWRAGIRDVSKEGIKSRWVPVVRVADLKATMDKAVKLGGSVAMKPHKDISNGNVAVIIDNTGALLLVQRWNASTKGDN